MSTNVTNKHITHIAGNSSDLFCGTADKTLNSKQIGIANTSGIRSSFDSRLAFRNLCGWYRLSAVLDDLDSNKIIGGIHSAENLSELNNDLDHPSSAWTSLRSSGMLGYTSSDEKYYKLENDLTTWTEIKFDVTELNDLNNVNISSASNNQILRYNSGSSTWVNVDNTLSALADTNIGTPTANQLLAYNGVNSKWELFDLNLSDIGDVSIGSATDGNILVYSSGAGEWNAQANNINTLSDVSLSSLVSGDILSYNGSEWTNITNSLSSLSDVTITSATDGSMLYFDDTTSNKWVNTKSLMIESTGDVLINKEATICGTFTIDTTEDSSNSLFMSTASTDRWLKIQDSTDLTLWSKTDSESNPAIVHSSQLYIASTDTNGNVDDPISINRFYRGNTPATYEKITNRDLFIIQNGTSESDGATLARMRPDGELNMIFCGDTDFGGDAIDRKFITFQMFNTTGASFANPATSSDESPGPNSIGHLRPLSDSDGFYSHSYGGLSLTGYSRLETGLIFCGVVASPDDQGTIGAFGAVAVVGSKADSNTVTSLANNENAFIVKNYVDTKLIVKGNGDLLIDGSQSSYDSEDDIELARAAKLSLSGTTESIIQKYKDKLNDLGIMQENFINVRKMHALELGALGQMMNMVRGLAEKIGISEDELFQMSKAY